jgi:lipopolysaccharide transport system permease protein
VRLRPRHATHEPGRERVNSVGTDEATKLDKPARANAPKRFAPGSTVEKPVIEVAGGPGRITRESFRELWLFREVLSAFVVRQVKVKYKQAAVGIGWVVLQPLIAAALFAVFLGRLSGVSSEGAPYLLFALAGTAGWSFFSSGFTTASESLVRDQGLLRKVFFPREILPLSAVIASVVDLVPALVTVAVAAALYGRHPSIAIVALPLPLLVLFVAAAGLGMILSSLNVYYRDVRLVLPFVIQLALFASPVVYSLDIVPSVWRTPYAILNPAAAGIDGIRRIFVHGTWPDFGITFGALAWSSAIALFGYWLFKRLERGFSDRV